MHACTYHIQLFSSEVLQRDLGKRVVSSLKKRLILLTPDIVLFTNLRYDLLLMQLPITLPKDL